MPYYFIRGVALLYLSRFVYLQITVIAKNIYFLIQPTNNMNLTDCSVHKPYAHHNVSLSNWMSL